MGHRVDEVGEGCDKHREREAEEYAAFTVVMPFKGGTFWTPTGEDWQWFFHGSFLRRLVTS